MANQSPDDFYVNNAYIPHHTQAGGYATSWDSNSYQTTTGTGTTAQPSYQSPPTSVPGQYVYTSQGIQGPLEQGEDPEPVKRDECPKCESNEVMEDDYLCEKCRFGI